MCQFNYSRLNNSKHSTTATECLQVHAHDTVGFVRRRNPLVILTKKIAKLFETMLLSENHIAIRSAANH